tara:strand:- start:228 stop:563 length:336 start_codon:yes stop_codon:yes gene_type:complete
MVSQSLGPNIWKHIMNQRLLAKESTAKKLQSKYRGNKTRVRLSSAAFTNKQTFNKAKKIKALKPHLQRNPQRIENARKRAGLRTKPRNSVVGHLSMPSSFWTQGKKKYYLG